VQKLAARLEAQLRWVFAQLGEQPHPGLDRMRGLLHALGDPARAMTSVQIAGTNGKGSVTRMLGAMLRAAGHRTGEFVSPHLNRVGERILIDGEPIEDAALSSHLDRLEDLHEKHPVMFFELLAACAALEFERLGVTHAALEVGLGGRLDATTTLPAKVGVISSIALDHTQILGSDVASIAREKAGIIRHGQPVVTGATEQAFGAIQAVALERHATLWAVDREIELGFEDHGLDGLEVRVRTPLGALESRVRLCGAHQARNAALAIAAAQHLALPEHAIRSGLETVVHPGRLEHFPRTLTRAALLLDGAHNPAATAALADFVKSLESPSVTLLIAGLEDKDNAGIAEHLRSLADQVVCVSLEHPRAVPGERLAGSYPRARVAKHPSEGLELAAIVTPIEGLIVVAGSLALIGAVRRLIDGE
jgi:dihydrofolate synthase / folylpolyglutamate synthase